MKRLLTYKAQNLAVRVLGLPRPHMWACPNPRCTPQRFGRSWRTHCPHCGTRVH